MAQGRRTFPEAGLEPGHHFVARRIKHHIGGNSAPLGNQLDALVARHAVGIRTQGEQILCCLYRGKTGARDEHRTGSGKTFDGRAHRAFQLQHFGRGRIARIECLGVFDQGQRQCTAVFFQRAPQIGEAKPQRVRVEIAVPSGVLEGSEITLRALRNFAQHEASIALAPCEVPALAVGCRALGYLHEKRQPALREPGKQAKINRRSEIVAVGNEQILDPFSGQLLQPAGTEKRRIQVAVSGRTPLEVAVLGPIRRLERVGVQLGHFVLQKIEPSVGGQIRIFLEMPQRVGRGAEAVHEQKPRPLRAVRRAQGEDLPRDKIEEIEPVLHRNERLGPFESHARAETAVQFDHAKLVEQCGVGPGRSHRFGQGRDRVRRFQPRLGHESRLPRSGLAPGAGEAGARGCGEPRGPHLGQRRIEAAFVHAFLVEAM